MDSNAKVKPEMTITPEQLAQVIDAILEGKYSWACVLILQHAGYNPLHYIPYRTYNRLMKENCQNNHRRKTQFDSPKHKEDCLLHPNSCISDLDYMEPAVSAPSEVRGGDRNFEYFEPYSVLPWNR